jgi:hypothetical protein
MSETPSHGPAMKVADTNGFGSNMLVEPMGSTSASNMRTSVSAVIVLDVLPSAHSSITSNGANELS